MVVVTHTTILEDTASPVHDDAEMEKGELDMCDCGFSPIALTPSHIMENRYKRTYFQYVIQI